MDIASEYGKFSYDLLSELRNDSTRRAVVEAGMQRIDSIASAIRAGKAKQSDLTRAQGEIIPLCGFNFGLLIPSYFPRYPLDKPLDFSDRPFMFAMTCLAPNSVLTLKAGRQVGKCADGATEVTTREGRCTLASIFEQGLPINAANP